MSYGKKLLQARNALEWTLTDAAKASGVSRGIICYWENEARRPGMELLIRYMRALKMSAADQEDVLRKAGLPALTA